MAVGMARGYQGNDVKTGYKTGTNRSHNNRICSQAARVRTGAYGQQDQIKVRSITDALAAISKTIELVGQPSLLYKAPNEYILPLEWLVQGFR